jgi:multiple sugar transport system ATP-binding protein
MATIEILNIQKRYGQTSVLKDVSLTVHDGEFLTLVGPSGCGKSTLLRIIAGLERQNAGKVMIGARNVDDARPKQRDVAMVFQSYALYPHLTAFDNMAMPLRIRRLSSAQRFPLLGRLMPGRRSIERQIRSDVEHAAAILDVGHLLHRKPGQLSGGQRQRVALGRAMVRQPAVFLMDEPLSNLDAKLRVQMRAEITALHRRLGVTFVYVTHDQAEAMTMSSRVAVMMDGELLQVDKPEELYRNPSDLRVAEMIGSPKINVVPLRCWAATAQAPAVRIHPKATSVAFRPESAVLAAAGPGALIGEVTGAENLGSDIFVHIALREAGGTIVVRTNPEAARFDAGSSVGVHVEGKRLLQFDDGGKRCYDRSEQAAA